MKTCITLCCLSLIAVSWASWPAVEALRGLCYDVHQLAADVHALTQPAAPAVYRYESPLPYTQEFTDTL